MFSYKHQDQDSTDRSVTDRNKAHSRSLGGRGEGRPDTSRAGRHCSSGLSADQNNKSNNDLVEK